MIKNKWKISLFFKAYINNYRNLAPKKIKICCEESLEIKTKVLKSKSQNKHRNTT